MLRFMGRLVLLVGRGACFESSRYLSEICRYGVGAESPERRIRPIDLQVLIEWSRRLSEEIAGFDVFYGFPIRKFQEKSMLSDGSDPQGRRTARIAAVSG
jgi:hypothetical protein